MEYPEKIYAVFNEAGSASGRRHAYQVGYEAGKAEQSDYIESMSSLESVLTDVEQLEGEDLPFVKRLIERAFRAGKAEQLDPLAGYSSLTAAISAGEPIDYEKLDGLVAKCVHSTLGDLLYPLEVDGNGRKVIWESEGKFWFTTSGGKVWAEALREAWDGQNGWTLWVEGEVPLIRKTADQLKVGTYFLGQAWGDSPCLAYVGHPLKIDVVKTIFYAPEMLKAITPAYDWVVLEEYGTFQKPEGR